MGIGNSAGERIKHDAVLTLIAQTCSDSTGSVLGELKKQPQKQTSRFQELTGAVLIRTSIKRKEHERFGG
jgi:hypothetical protein